MPGLLRITRRDDHVKDPPTKYRPYTIDALADRRWPDARITRAPQWCSVDLRDGNQALIEPMDAARKLECSSCWWAWGFKEIEVGFPSASQTDFDFVARLIEEAASPMTSTIQVLHRRAGADRPDIRIAHGAKRAIVHFYNVDRARVPPVVFGRTKRRRSTGGRGGAPDPRLLQPNPEPNGVPVFTGDASPRTELHFASRSAKRSGRVAADTRSQGHSQPARDS